MTKQKDFCFKGKTPVKKTKYIFLIFLFLIKINFLMGVEAGCSSIKGNKKVDRSNQDACGFFKLENRLFFYVFDGHGKEGEVLARELVSCFKRLSSLLPGFSGERLLRLINGNLAAVGRGIGERCGACGLYGYIEDDQIYLANVGDCQAGMYDCNGWRFTSIHRTNCNINECNRIRSKGGYASIDGRSGFFKRRTLGISRVYGDMDYKEIGVTDEAEYYSWKVNEGKALILGTDGFWERFKKDQRFEKRVERYRRNPCTSRDDCEREYSLEEDDFYEERFSVRGISNIFCKKAVKGCNHFDDCSTVFIYFDERGDGRDCDSAGCVVESYFDGFAAFRGATERVRRVNCGAASAGDAGE